MSQEPELWKSLDGHDGGSEEKPVKKKCMRRKKLRRRRWPCISTQFVVQYVLYAQVLPKKEDHDSKPEVVVGCLIEL